MRHIREIIRLKNQNKLSVREIARSCGLPTSTVGDYCHRAEVAGLTWPLPEGISDCELMERLMNCQPTDNGPSTKPLPDWNYIHEQLRRPNVTLQLLWQEYLQIHPQGYQYSRFCELYDRWANTLDPVMRQVHEPGQKLFVDWAGQTVPIHHADGSIIQASLFVAVLGASNKIYAEAFANQKIENWIDAHCHAFVYYGGVTKALVPDNTKTAVIRANFYEPVLNRTYQEMADHYGTVILPARALRPRDKAKVETGVQIAQRQILAALRDQTFLSVEALNKAVLELMEHINAKSFQKLQGSRNSWFEAQEKACLLPLPQSPFELSTWTQAKVNIDYHVAVDNHFYSVPFKLIHRQLDVRLTTRTVELFYQRQRVAAHQRSGQPGKFTTIPEHRPKSHQRYLEWTPTRMVEWARSIGPQCAMAVEHILASRPHPEQGFRSCLGIIRLSKSVGSQRMEAACHRALRLRICTFHSIKSILERRLDQQPLEAELDLHSPEHENVRGQEYYV